MESTGAFRRNSTLSMAFLEEGGNDGFSQFNTKRLELFLAGLEFWSNTIYPIFVA